MKWPLEVKCPLVIRATTSLPSLSASTIRCGSDAEHPSISTPVSDPQPGDLVFFVGTYDTPGVSHVGIYVGDNMMLHCGDPISYTNLNTSYWQSHFYAYGRPPYN